jgi:hypothetical protein
METCPCCGFKGLDQKPYANMPSISETKNKPIPYEDLWGFPSYDVCSCCGYEFGFNDNPGNGIGETFEEARREWIEDGCKWFEPSEMPPGWSAQKQLEAVGLSS